MRVIKTHEGLTIEVREASYMDRHGMKTSYQIKIRETGTLREFFSKDELNHFLIAVGAKNVL